MVRGLPLIHAKDNSCESWISGKQHKDNFKKETTYRAKETFKLVHTDLCGPIKTQLVGGSFYYLTFIDDYSRYTWSYFLKNKSKTFAKFIEFKALVEKQSVRYIIVLKSDRGGEYDSPKFVEY